MDNQILCGDALEVLKTLPSGSVYTCVTSPPYYGLRDYGNSGQIGLEESPRKYIAKLVEVFREVRRVVRDDGTLWVNIADSYADRLITEEDMPEQNRSILWDKIKQKDMIGIPWALAFALRADGWYLRADVIWQKTNPMPEGAKDRPTKSYEHIFLLSKSPRYYFDYRSIQEPVKESTIERAKHAVGQHKYTGGVPGQTAQRICQPRERGEMKIPESRRKRDVWTMATTSYHGAHFATYPVALIMPCIFAGAPVGGVVLDPFFGSGTTGVAAAQAERKYIGIELNPDFCNLARERIAAQTANAKA